MELLHIPVEPSNYQKANQVYQQLGGKGDVILKFASEEVFNKIKEHPFYQLAVT
jgi:hypothetical protein